MVMFNGSENLSLPRDRRLKYEVTVADELVAQLSSGRARPDATLATINVGAMP